MMTSTHEGDNTVTYVVTDNCINCKHTTCVEVCPTDAFREGPNFLAIDPEYCVDCDLCPAECPADAIYADDDLPEHEAHFLKINKDLAQQWPTISRSKAPLPDFERWDGEKNKLILLITE